MSALIPSGINAAISLATGYTDEKKDPDEPRSRVITGHSGVRVDLHIDAITIHRRNPIYVDYYGSRKLTKCYCCNPRAAERERCLAQRILIPRTRLLLFYDIRRRKTLLPSRSFKIGHSTRY